MNSIPIDKVVLYITAIVGVIAILKFVVGLLFKSIRFTIKKILPTLRIELTNKPHIAGTLKKQSNIYFHFIITNPCIDKKIYIFDISVNLKGIEGKYKIQKTLIPGISILRNKEITMQPLEFSLFAYIDNKDNNALKLGKKLFVTITFIDTYGNKHSTPPISIVIDDNFRKTTI